MKIITIADLHEIGATRKGTCLSKEYIDSTTPYKWRCNKGHTWDMALRVIRGGGWCPMCSRDGDMEEYFEKCKAYAKERNGEFLTTKLANKKSKSKWRCDKGHEWLAVATRVMSLKSWCATCSKPPRFTDINMAHDLAGKRGGKCLSTSLNGIASIIKLECSEGHQWETKFLNLKYGRWCKICTLKNTYLNHRLSFSEILKGAKKCKIQILTSENKYETQMQVLNLMCDKGHKWKDSAQSFLYFKRGCPECTSRRVVKKHSLHEMKAIAATHGGECLSKKYKPTIMLDWKCRQNHLFKMTSISVMKGKWCLRCSGRLPYGMEDMIRIAKSHNGKCLSTEYVSGNTYMKWKCEKGHIWQSKALNIIKGKWCPECGHAKPYTLDDFKKFAFQHGGECLNTEYKHKKTPLVFKCKQGHVWKSHRKCIIDDIWCVACSSKRYTDAELIGLFNPGIEDMKILAKEMKGECMSGYFINMNSPLRWKCKKGHEWKASYNMVRTGSWCPKCIEFNGISSYNAELLSIIRHRNGKLLSLKISDKVKVMCKKGHTFSALKSNIRLGEWCEECGERPTINYKSAFEYAATNGGTCLTPKEKMKSGQATATWRCSKGHEWQRAIRVVIATKTWCPQCG